MKLGQLERHESKRCLVTDLGQYLIELWYKIILFTRQGHVLQSLSSIDENVVEHQLEESQHETKTLVLKISNIWCKIRRAGWSRQVTVSVMWKWLAPTSNALCPGRKHHWQRCCQLGTFIEMRKKWTNLKVKELYANTPEWEVIGTPSWIKW